MCAVTCRSCCCMRTSSPTAALFILPACHLPQVPSGLLPVIEIDGKVVTESTVIMNLLEETFPDTKPLMPAKGTPERARADVLMRLERRFFSDWLQWLTSSYNHAGGGRL
jgi:glutathione S-transferase